MNPDTVKEAAILREALAYIANYGDKHSRCAAVKALEHWAAQVKAFCPHPHVSIVRLNGAETKRCVDCGERVGR